MYLVDRKIKVRLLYAFFLLYIISIIASFHFSENLFSGNNQLWIDFTFTYVYLGGAVLLIFLTVFLQSLYRIFLSQLNRVFIPFILIEALVMILFSGNILAQIVILSITLITGFPVIGYMLFILNRIKSNPFLVKIIIIKILLFIFIILWGIIASPLELSVKPPDLLVLFLPFIYIFLAVLYEAVFTKRQRRKIDMLYREMKLRDKKTSLKHETSITENSEQKLETVIKFIKENYTSDISREGLAAAVDMNTSYFSTLFNSYTGKKINEFIHSLRIEDAIEMLKNSDDKIIEIAYNVGFDSLATFNRAFKHETGSTPTEYRKSLG